MADVAGALILVAFEFMASVLDLVLRRPAKVAVDPRPRLSQEDRQLALAIRRKYRVSPDAAADLVVWAKSQSPQALATTQSFV